MDISANSVSVKVKVGGGKRLEAWRRTCLLQAEPLPYPLCLLSCSMVEAETKPLLSHPSLPKWSLCFCTCAPILSPFLASPSLLLSLSLSLPCVSGPCNVATLSDRHSPSGCEVSTCSFMRARPHRCTGPWSCVQGLLKCPLTLQQTTYAFTLHRVL